MSQTHAPELGGYCPVAYFAVGEAMEGKPEFSSTHNSKVYYFVSEAAKQEFDENPEKYVPAYGGLCAFGMSIEKEFEPCPMNFKIIDGKLYLFLKTDDTDALELWNREDESKCIAHADRNWAARTTA
tara:strand:+ start:324 stop:704 length:381 start_codon:yes stop_codon:yes gene_type:complete